MRRVLVAEDNRDLAYGLRNNLEIEGYEVHVAEDGRSALELVGTTAPDLIVLDIMLPHINGFQVLRTLREEMCDTPVLILTARGEEVDKVRGLKLGADDYLTKPFGVLEFLARVEALLRRTGRRAATDAIGDLVIDRETRVVTRNGNPVDLAPKEYDLLIALLDRNGAIVSRLDLLRRVWGYSSAAVTRTIDTHIAELRRKVEDDPSSPKLILTVRKVGYRLRRG